MSVHVWVFKKIAPIDVYRQLEEECWKIRGPNRRVGLRWDSALKFTSCCVGLKPVRGLVLYGQIADISKKVCIMCDAKYVPDPYNFTNGASFKTGEFLGICRHRRGCIIVESQRTFYQICDDCLDKYLHDPVDYCPSPNWNNILRCNRCNALADYYENGRYYCRKHHFRN